MRTILFTRCLISELILNVMEEEGVVFCWFLEQQQQKKQNCSQQMEEKCEERHRSNQLLCFTSGDPGMGIGSTSCECRGYLWEK